MNTTPRRYALLLLPPLLALTVTGCKSYLPAKTEVPRPNPLLMQPPPPPESSASASVNIKRWQKLLIDSQGKPPACNPTLQKCA